MAHRLELSWNELRTNLRVTCGKLATNLQPDTQDQYSSCRRNTNMGKLISEKYAVTQHKSNLRNIRGTFAAEGMTISKSTRSNLDRIASGQTSYQQVLTELRAKYEKRF